MSYTLLLKIQGDITVRYVVAQLIEALRYKPEGRGFDHWDFPMTCPLTHASQQTKFII